MNFVPVKVLALLLLVPVVLLGQPNVEWVRNFDNGQLGTFEDIYAVSDGGYIACGSVSPERNVAGGIFVVRTDSDGQEIWTYRGELGSGIAHSIIETDDGDFVCGLGHQDQFSALKLSADGDLIWLRDYSSGRCRGVIEIKSGDFILCGNGSGQGQLAQIDGDGEEIWLCNYQDGTLFEGVRQSEDNSVIAAGRTADQRAWALKADLEDGGIIWSEIYWRSTVYSWSITSTHDGKFAFTGFASYQDFATHPFILKIGQNGGEDWLREFSIEPYHDRGSWTGRSIARARDGGFAIAGYLLLIDSPDYLFCLRTNSAGQTRWMAEIDLEGNDSVMSPARFRSGVFDQENCIVAAGYATNRADGTSDAIILKFASDFPDEQSIIISPEDTVLSVLRQETVDFSISLNGDIGQHPDFEWFIDDSLVGEDTSYSHQFNELGLNEVACEIHFDQSIIPIRWHVSVTDLFIVSYTPDTLDFTLRRGSVIDFTIDSVAAIEEEEPVLYQWTLNDIDRQEEVSGGDAQVTTFDFTRSGHYIVEGMAYRGESHDELVWDVEVRGAIWSFLPEELNVGRLEGENVEFQIIPTISDSINWYTWLYDGGMIREGRDSVFVMNLFELGEHTITGILADSVESDTVNWTVLVESNSVPPSLSLEPLALGLSASPNPFNSMLTIRFSLGAQGLAPLRLAVYDLSGREVAHLLDPKSEIRNQKSEIVWNASGVPAGVYLVRLQQGSQIRTRKVVLLR